MVRAQGMDSPLRQSAAAHLRTETSAALLKRDPGTIEYQQSRREPPKRDRRLTECGSNGQTPKAR